MKRDNKGLFGLMKDCNGYVNKKSRKKTPIHKRRSDHIDDAELVENKNVENGFYDFNETLTASMSQNSNAHTEEHPYERNDPYVEDFSASEPFFVEPFEESRGEEIEENEVEDTEATQAEQIEDDQTNKIEETRTDEMEDDQAEVIEIETIKKEKSSNRNFQKKEKEISPVIDVSPVDNELDKKGKSESENEDFLNDLKSILKNKKNYSDNTKKEKSTAEDTKGRTVKKPRQQRKQEEPSESIDKVLKNEHQIFDKIAQSMRMANAYDLGSIALEQRFDSFEDDMDDQEEEEQTVVKKK